MKLLLVTLFLTLLARYNRAQQEYTAVSEEPSYADLDEQEFAGYEEYPYAEYKNDMEQYEEPPQLNQGQYEALDESDYEDEQGSDLEYEEPSDLDYENPSELDYDDQLVEKKDETPTDDKPKKKGNPVLFFSVIGGFVLLVVVGAVTYKVLKKKQDKGKAPQSLDQSPLIV